MPEMNGIEATRRIVAAHPDVVVFLCSTYDLADLPRSATESGASGYVNKERFGAEALRQLWQDRDSGAFVSVVGAGQAASGTEPLMVAPCPGRESQRTVPADGAEPVGHVDEAVAAAGGRGVEPRAVVGDREQQAARFGPQPQLHRRLRRVLGRVLQRLQAGEIDRGLDLCWSSARRRRPRPPGP